MIKNYFKIAWRNLIKNKLYSAINLTGLTMGMTCFILIAFYIQFELSYDKHHDKADDTYRILSQQFGNEFQGTDLFAVTPLPLGNAMLEDFPETQLKTAIESRAAILKKGEVSFFEQGIITEQSFFDVFNITVTSGVGKQALQNPENILLTESLANKLFGSASALGQTVFFDRDKPFTVKGIVADPPENQHVKYAFIASFGVDQNYIQNLDLWDSNCCHTYVTLESGSDAVALTEKLTKYDKLTGPKYKKFGLQTPKFILQPLKDVHLYSNANMELSPTNSVRYIYLFSAIALIILLLAAINYMNLTTVQSAQRAKEIGMTKVLGAKKNLLVAQFLGESFLYTLISFIMAFVFAILLLPLFNDLLDKNITYELIGNQWFLISMLILAIIISGMSGLYPAIFLSRVSPIKAIQGDFFKNVKGSLLRNGLVVGQFAAAIILAIGSVIVYQQLQFAQSKNLGYNRQHVIHVPYGQKEIGEKEDVIKKELLSHPKIKEVSVSNQIPIGSQNQGPISYWEGNNTKEQLFVYRSYVDYDYMDLFEMEIVEGRKFSEQFATDEKEAYIINESAVKALGWKNAVGKKFDEGVVIGVVKDYHLQKFDLAIEPMFLKMRHNWQKSFGEIIMKVNTENFEETRNFITKKLNASVPSVPFDVRFLDETYAQLYTKEKRLGKMFNIFTFMALFIACMGLFGLVSHAVLKRTKEIGIRKVLGSSTFAIVSLISKDFLKLILIALLVASPIAYYFMNRWLQDFAYQTEINWWVFALVSIIALFIAFITISLQSIKAAISNPVESLRSE
ncbi:ABC transporter permease [Maribacter sp. LLG6340-A2]|uniref:ABC transporter permease n=1 Tax=Maribacter sp. LLG6340-A2 TaxID=3160834 RepID=UPI00386602D0